MKGIRIKKESGGNGIVHDVLGIYPYEYLLDRFFPNVSNKKDIIDYLVSHSNEDEAHLKSMSKDALKTLFMNVCIKEQLSSPINNNTYLYSEPVKGMFAENGEQGEEKEETKEEDVKPIENKEENGEQGEENEPF